VAVVVVVVVVVAGEGVGVKSVFFFNAANKTFLHIYFYLHKT